MHTCGEVMMLPTYHVFASVTFEKRFDFNSCYNECVSTESLTMTDTDSQLFSIQWLRNVVMLLLPMGVKT